MQTHSGEFKITTMYRVLIASRGGYYQWLQRGQQPTLRQQRRACLDQQVAQAFEASRKRKGSPRLTRDLARQGFHYDRKTVAASMKRQDLRAKAAKKFKATTNSQHKLPVGPNLLQQDFSATAPNQKWVGDITCLLTEEGWLYLAVIIDLYSRLAVGWAMAERMTADLVCRALQMALWRRKIPKGVIVHSDRGSQYCSALYQELLTRYELLCSMSARDNCYDNACAESFFHTLKVEAIHGERFATRAEMRSAVFEYIEVDYNRSRDHRTNGYMSPEAFEALNAA